MFDLRDSHRLIIAARSDCLWKEVGQQGGDGGRVAHMDVVDGSSSSHEGQAQLNQATSDGGLFCLQLEKTGGKRLC